MSKSPKSPKSPSTASFKKRGLSKMFSRAIANLRKEKQKQTRSATPLHTSIPSSQSPPLPHRDFTSPDTLTDRKISTQPRYNHQLEHASNIKPCTAVEEKFPVLSTKPSCGLLPSARCWHNLRDKKVQNTQQLNLCPKTQKISKQPRPKKFTADDAEALQMYLQITHSTPVVNDRPINASSRNLTRDIHANDDSPTIDLLSNLSSDDDSIRSATSEITLNDYPWYFVEGVDDENFLYGLSSISFYRMGDLEKKYILHYEEVDVAGKATYGQNSS